MDARTDVYALGAILEEILPVGVRTGLSGRRCWASSPDKPWRRPCISGGFRRKPMPSGGLRWSPAPRTVSRMPVCWRYESGRGSMESLPETVRGGF